MSGAHDTDAVSALLAECGAFVLRDVLADHAARVLSRRSAPVRPVCPVPFGVTVDLLHAAGLGARNMDAAAAWQVARAAVYFGLGPGGSMPVPPDLCYSAWLFFDDNASPLALRWLGHAARGGVVEAQSRLAAGYCDGRYGLPVDYEMTVYWGRAAGASGDTSALCYLARALGALCAEDSARAWEYVAVTDRLRAELPEAERELLDAALAPDRDILPAWVWDAAASMRWPDAFRHGFRLAN